MLVSEMAAFCVNGPQSSPINETVPFQQNSPPPFETNRTLFPPDLPLFPPQNRATFVFHSSDPVLSLPQQRTSVTSSTAANSPMSSTATNISKLLPKTPVAKTALIEMECVETDITNNIPRIGMQFDSEEDAYRFYNNYGGYVGFSVRKDYHNKSLKDGVLIYRKYVCCKEGQRSRDQRDWKKMKPRAETRTNCLAHMCISLKRDIGKFVVVKWEDKHNHLLHVAECVHMMPSQRKVSGTQGINVDMADDCGISLKASYELMSIQAHYRQLCPKMVQLAARCSNLKPAHQLVNRGVDELFKQVEIMYASLSNEGNGGVEDHASFQNTCASKGVENVDPNILRVKGLKRTDGGYKGWDRLKPWHEKQAKNKIGTSHRSKVSQPIVSMSDEQNLLSREYCAHSNPLSSQISNGQENAQGISFDAESCFVNENIYGFFSDNLRGGQ